MDRKALVASLKENKAARTEQLRSAGLPNSTSHHLDAVIDEIQDMLAELS